MKQYAVDPSTPMRGRTKDPDLESVDIGEPTGATAAPGGIASIASDHKGSAGKLPGAAVPVDEGATLTPLSAIELKQLDWFWMGRIPSGELTILDGAPCMGKSTIAYDLAARLSAGASMPDGEATAGPADTILVSIEDDAASTIKPRIIAAGGDEARVHILTFSVDGDSALLALDEHLAELEARIVDVAARLVILDPLPILLGKANPSSEKDVRRVLGGLVKMLGRHGVAAIGIRHLTKGKGKSAINSGLGSIGFAAAARSVLVVGEDPEESGVRVLAVTKLNNAQAAPSLRFKIEKAIVSSKIGPVETSKLVWLGQSQLTANELVNPPRGRRGDGEEARAEAFLRRVLAPGPIATAELEQAAAREGIKQRTLDRARSAIGIKPIKEGKSWSVKLPEAVGASPTPPSVPKSDLAA